MEEHSLQVAIKSMDLNCMCIYSNAHANCEPKELGSAKFIGKKKTKKMHCHRDVIVFKCKCLGWFSFVAFDKGIVQNEHVTWKILKMLLKCVRKHQHQYTWQLLMPVHRAPFTVCHSIHTNIICLRRVR